MSYKNSFVYVQRQIDKLFRFCRAFARAYINDVIIFSKNQQKHLNHLKTVFEIFQKFNVSIKSSKTFFVYFSIRFLDQKMNFLNFVTNENKFQIINKFKFSITFRQLKHYLNLIEWFRKYVKNYVKISKLLQNRKIVFLKKLFIAELIRRFYSAKTLLQNSIEKKLFFYKILQKQLFIPRYFVHCSFAWQFYLNVDVSKKKNIEAMIYHFKQIISDYSIKIMVESIMFLNRKITNTESRYWSTELKLAGLIWILRKTKHMIESVQQSFIIYTDYEIAVEISRQKSLFIFSIDKLNLRLIKTFEYIQKFNIIIRYKFEKNHVVSNALSNLATKSDSDSDFEEKKLNTLSATVKFVFNFFFVIEISKEFRKRIIENYKKKFVWIKIQNAISKIVQNEIKIIFRKKNDLFYFENDHITNHVFQFRCLCLSQTVLKKIFQIVHNSFHLKFHKFYEFFFSVYYIREFTFNLKTFIKHCFECQINQIRRHKFHDSLQSIDSFSIFFHTVVMNFILTLFTTKKRFDCAMSVICKFLKKMILIPNKTIWKTKNWIETLLTRLNIMNWELPKQIINDRDRKFLNEFWKTLFSNLNVRLLYSTVYHPQTNDLFEKTNQSAEIALKYHLAIIKSIRWSEILSTIQKNFNNFIFSTKRISNESIYDFISTNSTDFAKNLVSETNLSPYAIRQKITDVIAFFQLIFKYHYDQKHKSVQLAKSSYALLRLHRDYSIFFTEKLKKKLFQQFVKSFKILKKIEILIYQLDISAHWRVHSVFIIVQFESVSNSDSNSYDRQRSRPPSMHVEENTDTIKNYVLKKIIRFRQSARDKKYFVKWKNYESEKNAWRNLPEMKNALNLIRKYEKITTFAFSARRFKHFEFKMSVFFQIRSSDPQSIRKRDHFKKTIQKWWKHTPVFLCGADCHGLKSLLLIAYYRITWFDFRLD